MYQKIQEGNIPRVLKGCKVLGVVQNKEKLYDDWEEKDEIRYSVDEIHYTKGKFYYVLTLASMSEWWVAGDLYKMDHENYEQGHACDLGTRKESK